MSSTRKIVLTVGLFVACFALVNASAEAQLCLCPIGCNGITGTALADTLTGTPNCDCINGLGGDD
ncbi:MAG TPA: hypothetical protein VFP10_14145, partial [Candidatus Eisenbacteria bacterium]|nr:hypothetical protein [Candidatus Eisenbacteria bacterium]